MAVSSNVFAWEPSRDPADRPTMRPVEDLLARELVDDAVPDVEAWWRSHRTLSRTGVDPADVAIEAGLVADRLAWAFASGYQAALRRLVPLLPADEIASLCATEAGGAHPRAIRTRLEKGRLWGKKTWATLAPVAGCFLVLATEGVEEGGRSLLRLVLVRPGPGLMIHAAPPPPFVPEVAHGELALDGVSGEVLPGDGWAAYVRPFRTLEDLHVFLALVAYVLGMARRGHWPNEVKEDLAAVLCALRELARQNPDSPSVHVALAGIMRHARAIFVETKPLWAAASESVRARWERDLPLLQVAEGARQSRRKAAWDVLAGRPRG
jgi:acyl-CoA dehydrogenase